MVGVVAMACGMPAEGATADAREGGQAVAAGVERMGGGSGDTEASADAAGGSMETAASGMCI